jgi:hypothetical protein
MARMAFFKVKFPLAIYFSANSEIWVWGFFDSYRKLLNIKIPFKKYLSFTKGHTFTNYTFIRAVKGIHFVLNSSLQS